MSILSALFSTGAGSSSQSPDSSSSNDDDDDDDQPTAVSNASGCDWDD